MKKTFAVLGTIVIVSMVMAALGIFVSPASATPVTVNVTSWPVDVHNPDLSFTNPPVSMTVANGNPSWVSGFSVTGSSSSADFTMKYQKTTAGEIVDQILVTPAVPAHCPDGYTLGLDPAHANWCAMLKTPGTDAYYVYVPEVPAVDPVMGCPPGYAKGVDPAYPDVCAKANPLTSHIEHRNWIADTYVLTCNFLWNGHNISEFYSKPTGDEKHCHRINWNGSNGLTSQQKADFILWHGGSGNENDYNNHIGSNPLALQEVDVAAHWSDWSLGNCPTFTFSGTKLACPVEPTCQERTVTDTQTYSHTEEIIITPGVPAYCPEGYTKGLDQSQPDACAKLIPATDASYSYHEVIPEVPAVYGCPEGSTPIEGGKCQYPDGTIDSYVRFLLNTPNNPLPTCPTCGPRVEEIAKSPNDLVIVDYGRGPCTVCLATWTAGPLEHWRYARSINPFSIQVFVSESKLIAAGIKYHTVPYANHPGYKPMLYIDAVPFVGLDGVTYYILDLNKAVVGTAWAYYDTATGKSYLDLWGWNSLTRSAYVDCSRTVGPWDISATGIASRLYGNPSSSDWVKFLMDNGYDANKAIQWSLQLWASPDGTLALPSDFVFKP
jgi:hypothetical protein